MGINLIEIKKPREWTYTTNEGRKFTVYEQDEDQLNVFFEEALIGKVPNLKDAKRIIQLWTIKYQIQ